MSSHEDWLMKECDAELLDADDERIVMEVGDSSYTLLCDFIGMVDVVVDWTFRVVSWTCPQCGHEHNEPDDEDPYSLDPRDEDFF